MTDDWRRDTRFFSTEERLKHALVPPKLYLRNLAWRRLRRGEKELHLLPALVDPGRVAIDIGANKGVYSYALSRLCRAVLAFEPNPKMYGLLAPAVPGNVTTYEVALSNATGQAELILPIQRSGRFSNQGATLQTKKLDAKDYAMWPVEQRTLDSYDVRDVAFIKIDVEGFELEVLDGAKATLARERPVLLVEIDANHAKRPVAEAVEIVRGYGYDCYYCSVASLRHFSFFAGDTARGLTDNFIFFPVR
jgi:FkbM family methyltransferase